MTAGRKSFFCALTEWFDNFSSNRRNLTRAQRIRKPCEESEQTKTCFSLNKSGTNRETTNGNGASVSPDFVKKNIIIGYCLVIIVTGIYVPWRIVRNINGTSINLSMGYSFIFSSPEPSIASVDYGLVMLEMIISTAVAIIAYTLRDRLSLLTTVRDNL